MKSLRAKKLLTNLVILSATICLAIASKPTRHASKELVEESITKRSDSSYNDLAKPYQFGYQIKDKDGNVQHRHEESDSTGAKRGSYGYVDANGVYRKVFYVADKNGFRIKEMKSNEPGFDAKVASEAMKETSKIKHPSSSSSSATINESPSSYQSIGQLSPSLLPQSSQSNYHNPSSGTSSSSSPSSPFNKISLNDRDLNNQLVKAAFNLNTSESKKDSSKAKSRNHHPLSINYESNGDNIDGKKYLLNHALSPETIKSPTNDYSYQPSNSGLNLIGNSNYVRNIQREKDHRDYRKESPYADEPYVYYAHPPAGESVNHKLNNPIISTLPVQPIDPTFPYPFVSPSPGYQSIDPNSNTNSLQSSHSIPIYSQLASSGKAMSPYLQPMPIHTYRAPNTNSSKYGVNYESNSPKTVYVPVYPPIVPNTVYSNEQSRYPVTPTTPLYGPFESTRLRPPEPTSPTTLGYMHPLQPIRSATTPSYGTSPSKYYNPQPIDNSIDRVPNEDHKHHHNHHNHNHHNHNHHPHHQHHPIDQRYHNGYPNQHRPHPYAPYVNPPYSSGDLVQSAPPYNSYPIKPHTHSHDQPPHSSSSLERPLQYLDGPGPGSMIDSEQSDTSIKKQNALDSEPLPYGHAPHRTGHDPHDPTPIGFESPFVDVPPTAPPVPPPEDNNQGNPSSGPHESPSGSSPPIGHPYHHSGPPSPPGHPLDSHHHHASNPFYNPNYNPYTANPSTDPARARLASYYQTIRQAAPPTSLSSLSASPSAATSTSSSSPSTSNLPSVLLGIQSAQGLEVATSLASLNDADANYNPSHYPTPDQLNKWKEKSRSNFRRNRNRNRLNSLSSDDESEDDSVISSSSDIDLKRLSTLESNNQRSINNNDQHTKSNYESNKLVIHINGHNNITKSTSTLTTTKATTSLPQIVRWPTGPR